MKKRPVNEKKCLGLWKKTCLWKKNRVYEKKDRVMKKRWVCAKEVT